MNGSDEPEGQRESTAIKGKVKRGVIIVHKLQVVVIEVNKSQQANSDRSSQHEVNF